MNFDLGPDQVALQQGLRDLCRARFPLDRVRAREKDGALDRSAWRELAEAGVFSLRLSEASGGVSLGVTEAVIVFEELGRRLIAGPLLGTHVAAALVPGAAAGERLVAVAERGRTPLVVADLDEADTVLVLGDDGVAAVDARTIEAEPVARPLDPLTPVMVVRSLPAGERVGDAAAAERLRLEGTALTAALLLGIAAGATESAVSYAKERTQFGRAIGSFQAVKHLCADMLVRTEIARAAVYAAAVELDGRGTAADVRRPVAAAALLAGEAAFANGKACVQVHGGMGFTWEVPAHLYLKRAAVLRTTFGSPGEHAAAIAAFL